MHYTLRLGSELGPIVATSLVATSLTPRYRSRERDEAVQRVAGYGRWRW
jgi:hypothetical protein